MESRRYELSGNWASMKVFVGILCLICIIIFANMTCEYALITTYEKAFGFSATEMSVLGMVNGVAFAVSLLVVMVNSKGIHVPRAISVATVTIGVATFLQTLPYFYGAGRGGMSDGSNSTSIYNEKAPLCHTKQSLDEMQERCAKGNISLEVIQPRRITPEIFLFGITGVLRMIMVPVFSILTTPYLDNHLSHEQSAVYLTYTRIFGALGPIIGMGLGSYLSTVPFDSSFKNLSPKDPQFIGAWWLCDLIFPPFIILAAIPMFFFPKHPHGWKLKEKITTTRQNSSEKCCSKLRDFFREVWNILKSKMWLWAYVASIIQSLGGSGLGLFLPKTLEHQFGFPAWQATLFIGGVFAFGGSGGSFINGCLIKILKMKPPAMAIHIMVTKVLIIAIVGCMIFVTCPQVPINSVDISISPNMTTSCNSACSCGQEAFAPICGADGQTYFSPCHAGCKSIYLQPVVQGDDVFYKDCGCIKSSTESEQIEASLGFCEQPWCVNKIIYLTLLFLWAMIGSSNDLSSTLFKYRAIKDDQKAIASGFGQITSAILRGAFSALVVGRLIDSTCAIWKQQCGEQKQCFMYNMMRYHFLVHILIIIFTVPSILFYIGAYIHSRKQNWDHLDKESLSEQNKDATELFINNAQEENHNRDTARTNQNKTPV